MARDALRRGALVMLALAVVAAGCSGGAADESPDEQTRAIAERWIDEQSGLTQMLREELFFDRVQRLGRVAHVRYLQAHGGVAVRGANFIVHVLADGTVQGASNSLTTALPADDATEQLSQDEAIQIAAGAVTGTVEGEPRVESIWLQSGGVLRLGWQVSLTTSNPRESWAVVVDASNGAVLSVETLTTSRGLAGPRGILAQAATSCRPTQTPSACIFVPDPVNSSGQPIDPANADGQLAAAPLVLPAGGAQLSNGWVAIDASRPEYAQADGVWGDGGSGTADFAAGSAYYWLTYTQQKMSSLGFPIHADDVVDVFPVDESEEAANNAFYDTFTDEIHLGIDDNGVLAAADATVMIHEYGHAVIASGVPGVQFAPDGGAFNEGGSDVLAVLMTLELRRTDPGCVWTWYLGAGQGCRRRIDEDKVYPADLVAQVHEDGEIYSGAVWDVFVGLLQQEGLMPPMCQQVANPCAAVRDRVLATYLGSLGYLTSNMTLNDAAAAFRLADAGQFDGTAAQLIDASFAAHGLSTQQAPSTGNTGQTGRPLEPSLALDLGHEKIGDLQMDLTVVDASGQTLCGGTIQTPDPSFDATQFFGRIPLAALGCETYLPPSPEQQWVLRLIDAVPGNVGTLVRFELFDGTNPHQAIGLPAPIPDNDPAGAQGVIGSG